MAAHVPAPRGLADPVPRTFCRRLADGAATTVHVVRYPLARWSARIVRLDPPRPLEAWCAASGEREALIGGFFVRPGGRPLGELWIAGQRADSVPFTAPWSAERSCVLAEAGHLLLAGRPDLPSRIEGDLLQAGPLLVEGGEPALVEGGDPEGFSSGAVQFDSDITVGRYPRAALGLAGGTAIAMACDGRASGDAGLTLREAAELMVALGCERAINLDGGGSTSLVSRGRLVNRPREEHGIELVAGRPVSTAIVFARRP